MLETMYPATANSRQTELAAAIDDTQTSITVLDGSILPDAPNELVIDPANENAETILYTGKTGNTLTGVTRGFEGVAQSWVAGTKIARFFTAHDFNTFKSNIEDLDNRLDNIPAPQDASLTQKGITQLSSATGLDSEDQAATPKAIKTVNDSLATHTSGTSVHGAVSAATANRLIIRDASGRAQIATPSAAADIARLDTVTGQVGTLADLQTIAKGSAVAAINEVFQSGVDAKKGIVDAVNAMGGSASTSDSWTSLASKIQSISTGKKFASGTITASTTTRAFTQRNNSTSTRRFVEISGLGFRPKTIILRLGILSNVVDGAYLQLAPIGNSEEYGVMNNGDVPRIYELSASGTRSIDGYINDVVALLPVSASGEYSYYAYE
ncbi:MULTISPECIES: tail fiber protein [unclassified Paenibacillus]|uniref:tail fiber protein n=1 Tax=unclassified Paenibacillus TaxID=185978 RepID=UPI0009A5DA58|nr:MULTISPECIES: phage tail protein [unclassified Paenibacillus]SLJ98096.1 Phage tail fibre repeat-containing protein [Paenibacillus sp. RU5A]SOC66819.1 Phage tail fibre repeat-containing protein [Paenibacillus sp. RU26A]SOC70032.1 Phage tail fibre repeat-containing protein [Paenibacillus sp. RU5M]